MKNTLIMLSRIFIVALLFSATSASVTAASSKAIPNAEQIRDAFNGNAVSDISDSVDVSAPRKVELGSGTESLGDTRHVAEAPSVTRGGSDYTTAPPPHLGLSERSRSQDRNINLPDFSGSDNDNKTTTETLKNFPKTSRQAHALLREGNYTRSDRQRLSSHLRRLSQDEKSSTRAKASEPSKTQESLIVFGNDANQTYHAFRHTDKMGLSRSDVRSSITKNFRSLAPKLSEGKPYNGTVNVQGKTLKYTAFRIGDGVINIGRIHGI